MQERPKSGSLGMEAIWVKVSNHQLVKSVNILLPFSDYGNDCHQYWAQCILWLVCSDFLHPLKLPTLGEEFLRTKKKLNPLQFACSILHGYSLSFPEGKGIDFIEPSFATTKLDPNGCIHGVSTLFSIEDAQSLNKQEGVGMSYNLEVCKVTLYDGSELEVEVYVPTKPVPFDFPEGACSSRYRNILVTGAKEANLHPEWIEKLENLRVYTPSDETLARRTKLPPPSSLPVMTIAELALHNGKNAEYPHYISSCGYIFKIKDMFDVYHGMKFSY